MASGEQVKNSEFWWTLGAVAFVLAAAGVMADCFEA
jgi:hypothetical protein